jgi:hypothetical protein
VKAGRLVAMTVVVVLGAAPQAGAEFDWPLGARLPHHDVAVGLSGGIAFAEDHGRGSVGGLVGVDLSYLHGVFGAHLAVNAFPERTGWRVQPLGEVTFWYVGLFGAGVSVAPMLGEIPSDAPKVAVALHALVGFPIPIGSVGPDAEPHGTFVLVPFARPGLRLGPRGAVTGHHTVGLMLKWTSFGF